MFTITEAQKASEIDLRKQGFKFSNWIVDRSNEEECNPDETPNGTMLMIRKVKFGRDYREIPPDGSIN